MLGEATHNPGALDWVRVGLLGLDLLLQDRLLVQALRGRWVVVDLVFRVRGQLVVAGDGGVLGGLDVAGLPVGSDLVGPVLTDAVVVNGSGAISRVRRRLPPPESRSQEEVVEAEG